jgi:hypothetical protein
LPSNPRSHTPKPAMLSSMKRPNGRLHPRRLAIARAGVGCNALLDGYGPR